MSRLDELTEAAHCRTAERDEARAKVAALQRQATALEDDLAASRTSLRRMIREGYLPSA
ncbi:hypothetical protein [Streptomyces californicus]|uniref:hypothetical protein n=1 Tax=Streptomyces californicus TaxID=67351 RepID=UPI0037BC5BE9